MEGNREKMVGLEQQWDKHRVPLQEKYDKLKQELSQKEVCSCYAVSNSNSMLIRLVLSLGSDFSIFLKMLQMREVLLSRSHLGILVYPQYPPIGSCKIIENAIINCSLQLFFSDPIREKNEGSKIGERAD